MAEHVGRSAETAGSSIHLPALSPVAADFVRQHPQQARLAVAAALEAAAAQFESLRGIERDIPDALRAYVVQGSATTTLDDVIDPDTAATRLGVSRATVYNWIEARRLIGWRLTRQGTLIPAEQIVGPGELVKGVDRVLQLIPEPRAAWRFLSEPSQHFDSPLRPIDALKAGQLEEVITAARASGETFT